MTPAAGGGSRRFLMGTVAHNQHIQNIAAALHELDFLGAYRTSGVDHWRSAPARSLRAWAGERWPSLNNRLSRRQVSTIPAELVHSEWRWEACRLAAGSLLKSPLVEDWFWEADEYALDRQCARLVARDDFGGFLGVEHGALSSLRAAKAAGKPAVVAFLSPHHALREKWEDAEYDRFPELMTRARKTLLEKARYRDARRDEEARVADVIHCGSEFTKRSLSTAGVPPEKLICVPLGCPDPPAGLSFPPAPSNPTKMRFLYSGPVSVRKGAHILLDAWQAWAAGSQGELHFYGRSTMPERVLRSRGDGVFFHGSVSKTEIGRAYRESSVLVFPTLCDGFGMVVAEAFAHGLPVIVTPNAGAADLVVEGRNGFIVPARDPQALAERMEWCATHPREVAAMREAALETARTWSWASFRRSFQRQLLAQLRRLGH